MLLNYTELLWAILKIYRAGSKFYRAIPKIHRAISITYRALYIYIYMSNIDISFIKIHFSKRCQLCFKRFFSIDFPYIIIYYIINIFPYFPIFSHSFPICSGHFSHLQKRGRGARIGIAIVLDATPWIPQRHGNFWWSYGMFSHDIGDEISHDVVKTINHPQVITIFIYFYGC